MNKSTYSISREQLKDIQQILYLSIHCTKRHVVFKKRKKKRRKYERPTDYVITVALLTADNLFLGFHSNYLEIYC